MIETKVKNGRLQLVLTKNPNPQYEKMSKSRGNGISVDEAQKVNHLAPYHEFVTLPPNFIYVDYQEVPIYKDKDGFYYTYRIYGKIPVLLIDTREDYVPRFDGPDGPIVQHGDKPEVQAILED